MITTKDAFRQAIIDGDWLSICAVYQSLTNEVAPVPPVVIPAAEELAEALSKPISNIRGSGNPPVIVAVAESSMIPGHKELSLREVSEFHIEHKGSKSGGSKQSSSGAQCRREPMVIPEERANKFVDDGKQFSNESVEKHPELGVPNVRPRGPTRDAELGPDTGAMIDVQCSLCGQRETIAAVLAIGHREDSEQNTYRCNTCSSPRGQVEALRRQRGG